MAETHTVQGDRGVRLAVREWPSGGPSILLLHGLASSSHIWDLVAPRLAPRFRVVAYDQRGHGLSGKPSSGYGFDRLVADAAAVIRSLGLRRPVVVGHSWGANVALQLAWDRAELVSGDVLVDGGFLSMRDGMDWRTARTTLAPPQLKGMSLEQFRAGMRTFTRGAVELTPEVEAVFLSLMRVDRDGNIHPGFPGPTTFGSCGRCGNRTHRVSCGRCGCPRSSLRYARRPMRPTRPGSWRRRSGRPMW